ncbi:MAG: T9SS type A sorting domain-containing protein [Bacteroidales bacterium]
MVNQKTFNIYLPSKSISFSRYCLLLLALAVFFNVNTNAQEFLPKRDLLPKYVPDTRIDNMVYWRRMAELGLVPVQPAKPAPAPLKRTSKLSAPGITTYDSPDIPVTETNSLQSENSIFVDPIDGIRLLNSNNSHPAPYTGAQYGADALQSPDGGTTWEGTVQGAGGYNFGDPAVAISYTGRMFVGFIFSGGGQGVSYSDDNGQTWHKKGVASAPGGVGSILDKNHLWVDNSLSSLYKGFLYDSWTTVGGGTTSGEIQVSRSMDGGMAWQMPVLISKAIDAGSHNQGVNLHTGPDGEVYAVWSVYDVWPAGENALGFARSFNGGQNWQTSSRILSNIKGIRLQGVNKFMRVNSFPSMAVDISNSPNRGNIYVVWTNIGEPGINEGIGVDIYMIKSSDKGETWSAPSKINQDAPNMGKKHYFPWISCDPDNGNLSVVFYDDRNVPDNMCEAWVAVSKNGGISWQDFRISDVAFTPEPLTGMSDNYFGDYLGITSKAGVVYPCWTDNRTGAAMGYVSPFRIGPRPGQPFIDYYTHIINDSLSGNGNGLAEYGETFGLSLTMKNIGDQPDSAVNVSLSCDSPFVRIINNNQYFGNFSVGEIKNVPLAFEVRLSDSIPDDSELVFTLSASDKYDSTFLSSLVIRSHAPYLSIGPMFIVDSAGNNNHQLNAGETVILKSVLTNTGDYPVSTSVSKLSTTQDFCHISNPVVITGNLMPGHSETISWQMYVDSDVAVGTSAGFTDSLSYSGQEMQKLFLKNIGVLTEDWESGSMTKMAWKTGGAKPWSINNFKVYEGTYSLRSGYIKSLDTSSLSIDLNMIADDSISFYRKVSSELGYDFLNFYIDNLLIGQWSGEKDWTRVSFPVPAGMHTVRWEYVKDEGFNVGYDAAWIDFVEFPIQQRTTVNAGQDARICGGNSFQADATATNFIELNWSSSGTGMFDDPSRFDAIYFPSESDIEAGSVQLILSITGFSYGETMSDTLVLSIAPKPTINAGTDSFTCSGEVFTTLATASNYISINWSTFGDGNFTNPDTLNTSYSPGPLEIQAGKARLVLHIIPESVCEQLYDTLNLNIYPGFTAQFTGDTTICTGDTANLKLSFVGQGPWRVYLSDGSTITLMKPLLILPVSPSITTNYQIDSIINLAGCTFRNPMTVKVNVLQPPKIEMLGPYESCNGRQIILQANADSVSSFLWNPGEATTSIVNPMLNGRVGEAVKYKVLIKGINGCSDSDSLMVKVVAECFDKKAGNVDVRYFPNPNNGNFTLILSSTTAETANITIRTIDNKLIYSLENVQVLGVKIVNINLIPIAQGTYIIDISTGSGRLKDKVVVKRKE